MTSIEWLIGQIGMLELNNVPNWLLKSIETKAKEMHKKEIIAAYKMGRYESDKIVMSERFYTKKYYNETFKQD